MSGCRQFVTLLDAYADGELEPEHVLAWRSERWSPHPPLYYAVVKSTMAICGTQEACIRAPSVLCHAGIAALLVVHSLSSSPSLRV
jgi:uncharacterized membrane protein